MSVYNEFYNWISFVYYSNEKEGIPANILNLLDMAIEVPQFGVVRSLNVHVTASLFMWEYCKQHLVTDINYNR